MTRLHLILLIGLCVPIMAIAQTPGGSLEAAFNSAKQSKKPLLVVRYEKSMVDYSKRFHDDNSDSQLDSIMNEATVKQAFADEFVVYWLNTDSLNAEEAKFQDQFLLYYTPNFIVFDSEGELVHFYNPIEAPTEELDLLGGLRDTMKAKEVDLRTRRSLQEKFDKKAITTPELLELVTLRSNAHLKSKEAFNELALRKEEVPETLMEPILSQGFKTTDPMVEFILNTKPKNLDWAFYKRGLVESLFENAKMNKDKAEFERVLLLKGDYDTQAIEMASETYPETPFLDGERGKQYLNEQLLSEKFSFYASISDTSKVLKYGNQYAAYVLKDYEKRKKALVDAEVEVSDYMVNSFILTGDAKQDSVVMVIRANREKNRALQIKRMETDFDQENARILNHISWTFYEVINEALELEKALAWSEKSIELEENAFYSDTYAHLLFKLGLVDKAIEQETKALERAKASGHVKYIQEFEAELNRFKQMGKD